MTPECACLCCAMWFACVCVCLLGIHSEPSCWLALNRWNSGSIVTGLPDLVPLNRKCYKSSRNLNHVALVQLGLQPKPEGNLITGITPLHNTVFVSPVCFFCG